MDTKNLLNKYGLLTHQIGRATIHPDDVGKVNDFDTKQAIYRCIDIDRASEEYIVLSAGTQPFRALASRFIPIADPLFWIGDHVRVRDELAKEGIVYRLGWHTKEKQPLFYLRIGNRHSTHRYFARELKGVEED